MKDPCRAFLLTAAMALCLLAGCSTASYDMEGSPAAGSDRQLAVDVVHRLEYEGLTDLRNFAVTVNNGVATVHGVVPNEPARARVLAVVRGTPGVQDVVDKMQRW